MSNSNPFDSAASIDDQPFPPQPPVRVVLPLSHPIISYTLVGINIVIFLLDLLLGRQLTILGTKDNQMILAGQYWRLLTPVFLHANLLHLGFNCYFLYIVGPQTERHFRYLRFLVTYILAGLTGSVASYILTPAPSIGASGALFGLMGAMLPFLYRNRHILSNTRARIMNILQIIGINLVIGLLFGGIDNWAHIGGLLGGAALAWFATPRYAVGGMVDGTLHIRDDSSPLVFWLASLGMLGVLILVAASRF